jgi:hypothetical protein
VNFIADAYANFLMIRGGIDAIDVTAEVDTTALASSISDQLGHRLARELGEALIAGSEG